MFQRGHRRGYAQGKRCGLISRAVGVEKTLFIHVGRYLTLDAVRLALGNGVTAILARSVGKSRTELCVWCTTRKT
jgi:hypothetical protein